MEQRKRARRRDRRPDEDTFRFDRIVCGVRITRRSGTRSWRQFEQDNAILSELEENGQVETIRLFNSGKLEMPALRAAQARGLLASGTLIAGIALRARLWGDKGALRTTLKKMGESDATRARYGVSIDQLERKAAAWLGPNAVVADLEFVPWRELRDAWGASGSDWNRMRAMLSTFCTTLLGDKFHPFRRALMAAIPTADEVERVCELTVEQFWKAVEKAPEVARPIYVTLVATGMRWGEYQRCTAAHLNAERLTVSVPGEALRSNAKKRARVVQVAAWLWPWIEAGIPAPLGYKWTRIHWLRAVEAISGPRTTLHDLRHLTGQIAIAGVDVTEVADTLGHSQLSTTRRYVRQANQSRAARAVGKGLKPRNAASVPVLPLRVAK